MTDTSPPEFIVIRPGPGLPHGYLPEDLNGRWFAVADIEMIDTRAILADIPNAVVHDAGRAETNAAGQVAQVYELRP